MATAKTEVVSTDPAQTQVIQRALGELWWIAMLQGVLAVFFGVAAIFWPGLTLLTLLYLLAAFVIGWGIIEIVHGFLSMPHRSTWWLTLLFGIASLGIGVYLVRHPHVSFRIFVVLAGIALIARGLIDVVSLFVDKREASHKVITAIIGLAALAAGIWLLFQPVAGGVAFVWILGLYALIYGTLSIALAISTRQLVDNVLPPEQVSTSRPTTRRPTKR